jgi:hypothetical protein
MKVFDDIQRDYLGPPLYAEPHFTYLNRSARDVAEKARNLVEEWFSHYPEDGKNALWGRLRDNDDRNHLSATYELFLHELLLKLGCQIGIEAAKKGTSKKPDFLVEDKEGNRFYMEAVVATDESVEEFAAKKRINLVYDTINRMQSPNFLLFVRVEGSPATSPPGKKIRQALEQWLNTLDPNDEIYKSEDIEDYPHLLFEHDGWKIDFFPIAKRPKAREKTGIRPIAAEIPRIGKRVTSHLSMQEAIERKATKYGEMDLPYIIALNALGDCAEEEHILDAFFGQEVTIVSMIRDTGKTIERNDRSRDGALIRGNKAVNTRVSAVLLNIGLTPRNLSNASIRIYHNPWAQNPYSGILNELPRSVPKEGEMQYSDGKNIRHIFEISE